MRPNQFLVAQALLPSVVPDIRHSMKDEAKVRRGQAIGMQYVSFILQTIAADVNSTALQELLGEARTVAGADPRCHTILGCAWVSHIAVAFGMELALKALVVNEQGYCRRGHDLWELYKKLAPTTQSILTDGFCQLTKDKNVTITLPDLLRKHRDDFNKWRYLDDPVSFQDSDIGLLQLAMYAVLEVSAPDFTYPSSPLTEAGGRPSPG